MADDLRDLVADTLAAPLGDTIAAVGRGVAEAQAALDRGSLEATLAIYGENDEAAALLREIDYRPTFYALPETTCEVQVSLRIAGTGGADGAAPGAPTAIGARLQRARMYVTPVDAGFANRFGYEATASAKLSFKVVPVPPPAALDDIRPVPALLGRTGAEAQATLAALGLAARFTREGAEATPADAVALVVAAQEPAAPALLPIGAVVTLAVRPPPS